MKFKRKHLTLSLPAFIAASIIFLFTGCNTARQDNNEAQALAVNANLFSSFRDVPGITAEEIRVIEAFRRENRVFVYGMPYSTEFFLDDNNENAGFATRFCNWLSQLFGITFVPRQFELADLLAGLENGQVDFTGELRATDERRQTYLMTSAIAERNIKYYSLANSPSFSQIALTRKPRFGFMEGAATAASVTSRLEHDSVDVIFIRGMDQVHDMLKTGEIDAFFYTNPAEYRFSEFDDITTAYFFPLIFSPVSLTTQQPELAAIISVVDKVLENGGRGFLARMYNYGYKDYRRHKLLLRLTEEERQFLSIPRVIPFAAEHYNYPISFFNRYDRQWQGIFFDILKELEDFTSLSFELVNDENTAWPRLLNLLETGHAYMIPELLKSAEREGRFLWPQTATMTDSYALLSRLETPNISINEAANVRVGLTRGTAYAEMFRTWFPDHAHSIEYESSNDAFSALDRGEIDMVVSSQRRLLALMNYHEFSGYKANLVFDYPSESFIGFNRNQAVLASIIDKALKIIDVGSISSRWMNETFDYHRVLVREQRPWLIAVVGLLLILLILVFIMFQRKRKEGATLEKLVQKRTDALKGQLEITMELQKDLKKAMDAANAANQSKSAFLANMSHEIRTPLNAVIGLSELELGTDKLTGETADNMERIYDSGMTLLSIVNDILDISKIESGKLEMTPIEYYIPSLINDTINLNIPRIGSKPITFRLFPDENLPARIFGDELRIKQVFNNLLSNAFKYTRQGAVDWYISSVREGDFVWLESRVEDTGIGIHEENIPMLFTEYGQVDTQSNRKIEGTGLGLSISQKMAHLMDGEIKVKSEYGKGSVFSVRLKQKHLTDEVIGKEVADKLSAFKYAGHRRRRNRDLIRSWIPYASVLVVDDMPANLTVAKGILKPYGLTVDVAFSGLEAIEKIRSMKMKYNAVFMDHMMPGMDGIEAVRIIREAVGRVSEYARNIPIIALTANAISGNESMFLNNGFQAFLSKPIDIMQMDAVINQWVRDRKLEQELITTSLKNDKPPDNEEKKDLLVKEAEKINGLDIHQGIKDMHGFETWLEVVNTFVETTPDILDNMKDLSLENNAMYTTTVHGIKSVCYSFGAKEAGDMAKELETRAREKDMEFIRTNTYGFLNMMDKLLKDLEALLEKTTAKNDRPRKYMPDPDILAKVREAAENYDIRSLEEHINELEKFVYTEDPNLVPWIRKQCNSSEFTAIQQRLAKTKK